MQLGGSTWNASVQRGHVTTAGVPGVRVASVSRLTGELASVILAYDGSDFDSDATLTLTVAPAATSHTAAVSASVPVTAVVEQAPGRVTGVSVSPGPGSLTVSWNAAPGADGYKVQWRTDSQSFDSSRQSAVPGGATTSHTIPRLDGEAAYTVRVIATRSKAPADGLPSEARTATTLPAHAIVSATDPSPLTETNLDGATLTVDLLDYDGWARRMTDGQFAASGVPGVRVTGVTRVSDQRATVTVSYDGSDFDSDAVLRVEFYRAHRSIGTVTAAVRVAAVVEAPPGRVQNLRLTSGPLRIEARWDAVPDADGYVLQWKGPVHRITTPAANSR